ncbi:hypothetical protein PIGHUM_02925 [Pigmentiphaga humi]|uniref:Uncharacterized protein n=1 Tax=Pigmentiphaga humi TaxID=2478468 RepID=A0A3P4B5P1_9BURK|nr:hypothetical protein [Pigmentiphaga humi]VCU70846.1 hypothetical protein PIGHUM_02925 [Pigmentiphaga humi]
MKILRNGHNKFHGVSEISCEHEARVSFDLGSADSPEIHLALSPTLDPALQGEYRHEVVLSMVDIAAILRSLSESGPFSAAAEIGSALASSKEHLVRLLALASGLGVDPPRTRQERREEAGSDLMLRMSESADRMAGAAAKALRNAEEKR